MINQLKATRRARGLAIWGLAVMSGVSPSLLTAIEKWGYVPGSDTRKRIADALGMQVEDIWMQEEAPTATEADRSAKCGGGAPKSRTGPPEAEVKQPGE